MNVHREEEIMQMQQKWCKVVNLDEGYLGVLYRIVETFLVAFYFSE